MVFFVLNTVVVCISTFISICLFIYTEILCEV